jgi:competence protein ComGD
LVKGELFLLEFENLYKDTQEDAALLGQNEILIGTNKKVMAEGQELLVPQEIEVKNFSVKFNEKGENSSLDKIKFSLPYEHKEIVYQLELGSGKFKKKIS